MLKNVFSSEIESNPDKLEEKNKVEEDSGKTDTGNESQNKAENILNEKRKRLFEGMEKPYSKIINICNDQKKRIDKLGMDEWQVENVPKNDQDNSGVTKDIEEVIELCKKMISITKPE